MKQKLIVVVGPTGAGKSDIALTIAKDSGGFLISADSRQIYKELDIVTGKDEGEWQNGAYMVDGIEECMVDFLDPQEKYSAAEYQKEVYKIIAEKIDKLPIMVGGTGLYINAVVDNYDFSEKSDNTFRDKLEVELKKQGLDSLVSQLKEKDPKLELDFQNPRRVIRALEYNLSTGKLWSEESMKKRESKFDVLMIGIDWDREVLYDRINKRVDQMVVMGAIEETRGLYEKYGEDWPSVDSLGYQDFIRYFKDEITLEEAMIEMKKRSRHYAKRQLTWFKRDERIKWFDKTQLEEIRQEIITFLKK